MRLRRSVTGRVIPAAVLAATATIVLASCSAGDTAHAEVAELSDDQQVEIVFESYNLAQSGPWADAFNLLIDEFEEANPNISVVGQAPQGSGDASTNAVSSVQTQVLAGDPPDIAQMTFDALEFTATQLGAKPLSDIVSADELEEAFEGEYPMHERARTLTDWDGKTVGMPFVFSTPVLFINEDMLAEAGVTDPDLSTWDSVEEVAAQVTAHTGKPSIDVGCVMKGGGWCMQGLFKSNGAQVLSDDRGTIEFGSDQAVDTVEHFREMYDAGVLRNVDMATVMEGLPREDVAMTLYTSAVQGMFMQAADEGGWTLNAAPMPAFGDQEAVPTNSGSALFVLSEEPEKQRASWEFIRFMSSARAYEVISSQIGYLPLRTGLIEEGGPLYDWAQENPLIQPNIEQLDRLQPWVSFPGNSYAQVDVLMAEAIEESVYYGGDAATALPEAASRAQELIE